MKRLILVLAAVVASFAVASPALAYPPGATELNVSSEAPTPGSSITLTTDGFCGGSVVTFTLTPGSTVLGTAVADGSGLATITVAAPSSAGTYTITATASDCPGYFATASITVSGGGGGLPGTGSNSTPTLTLALIAVLAGVALVGVGALRRRTPTSV